MPPICWHVLIGWLYYWISILSLLTLCWMLFWIVMRSDIYIEQIYKVYHNVYEGIRSRTNAPILWFGQEDYSCELYYVLGSLPKANFLIDQINQMTKKMLLQQDIFIDFKLLIASIGITGAFDKKRRYRWGCPYSEQLIQYICKEIHKQIMIWKGISPKCLVIDCDNVLWGGIVSEDGLGGILLNGSGLGCMYRDFQKYLLYLYYHGVILTICSKLNTILNHTEVYHFEKGKLILHLRYDFESNKFCDTVGQKLRYYRQLKGYSTRQLADMVSVVPATITLYENDKHPIKYKTAVSIAEVLKIDRTLLLDDYTTFVDYPCNKLLQELRQKLNLNQSEIAAMIGVAPNSYSAWENASRTPRRQEYKNILPLLQKANITL